MNAIADELNARLLDAAYTRFRCAVAFVRWSGLHLIDQPLQRFANRPGTSLECFVGVDLGGTTIEALTYLHELPGCTLHVVRSGIPTVVFHPKVYALEGRNRWWVLIGSSRSGANRRGVLRFERTAPDAYRVSLQLAGQRRYAAWLARCDRQRPGSKRWGIH